MVVMMGLLVGIAASVLATALWPPRQAPVAAARTGSPSGGRDDSIPSSGWKEAATGVVDLYRSTSEPVGRWAVGRGMSVHAAPADLDITGRSLEAVLSAKIVGAAAAALLTLGIGVLLNRGAGLQAPVWFLLIAMVVLAASAYFLPDLVLRRQAAARRHEFVQALPVWCDLVALEMAGTAAPQEALVTAAESGTTWPMHTLQDTLYRAVRARQGHWRALAELGERIDVPDLAEFGRLSQLVSHEGAQVRDTLIERAASIRRRTLANSLGQAGQRDESMRLAVIVLAAGVILLIIFPGALTVMAL